MSIVSVTTAMFLLFPMLAIAQPDAVRKLIGTWTVVSNPIGGGKTESLTMRAESNKDTLFLSVKKGSQWLLKYTIPFANAETSDGEFNVTVDSPPYTTHWDFSEITTRTWTCWKTRYNGTILDAEGKPTETSIVVLKATRK